MNSNTELINHLVNSGVLQSKELINSIKAVDRKDFVPQTLHDEAYEDYPLPIGLGQTISQPYTVALMLELLKLKSDDKVLDIGCGSGWSTALLAHIVKEGSVYATERLAELLTFARHNISKYAFDNVHLDLATSALGRPGETFDKILVSAAATSLPFELVKQLHPDGIMVIPINDKISVIYKGEDEQFSQKDYQGFRFVPLIY